MGVYQNFDREFVPGNISCPRCEQSFYPNGIYFLANFTVPVTFRFLFVNITKQVLVGLSYCPKCGFLRVALT